ncbi:MAG: alpha/beta hydrolase [Magnetococcales bacterium]|nr:alpha/beta hydrolase [Magnetococcales bacterium]
MSSTNLTLYFVTNRNPIPAGSPSVREYGKSFHQDGAKNLEFGKVILRTDQGRIEEFLNSSLGNEAGSGNGVNLSNYLENEIRDNGLGIELYSSDLNKETFEELQPTAQLAASKMFRELKQVMETSSDVVVYIHGYAVTWQSAVASAMALELMLNRAGQADVDFEQRVKVVLFTWPSDGSHGPFYAYWSDRTDAEASAPAVGRGLLRLRDFLHLLSLGIVRGTDHGCGQELHLLCHSMGNYVLQNALPYLVNFHSDDVLPKLFDHIFLCAADVDEDALEPGQPLARLPELVKKGVSLYHNGSDRAMEVSLMTKHGKARLGDHGAAHPFMLHQKIDQIDCSQVVPGGILDSKHSYYLQGVVNTDIRLTMDGMTADDSRRHRSLKNVLGKVWVMK